MVIVIGKKKIKTESSLFFLYIFQTKVNIFFNDLLYFKQYYTK